MINYTLLYMNISKNYINTRYLSEAHNSYPHNYFYQSMGLTVYQQSLFPEAIYIYNLYVNSLLLLIFFLT